MTPSRSAVPTVSTGSLEHLAPGGPTSFDVLSPARCLELLGVITVGRVAFVAATGLQLLPVNVRLVGGILVLRVEEGSTLAELCDPHEVVLEVDHLSSLTREGWSVVVRATSSTLSDPAVLDSRLLRSLVPWAPARSLSLVALTPSQVTGRHVVPTGRQGTGGRAI